MKVRFVALASLVMLLCVACTHSTPASYTVTGLLPDDSADGKTIYITRQDDRTYVDTTVVQGDKFVFEGVADEPVYCCIMVSSGLTANLILENGEIKFDFNESKYPAGTPNNEELARINRMDDNRMKDYIKGMREAFKAKKSLNEYKEEYEKNVEEQAKELFQKHNDDVIGYYLLYTSNLSALSDDECRKILENLGPSLQQTSYVQYLLKQLNKQ